MIFWSETWKDFKLCRKLAQEHPESAKCKRLWQMLCRGKRSQAALWRSRSPLGINKWATKGVVLSVWSPFHPLSYSGSPSAAEIYNPCMQSGGRHPVGAATALRPPSHRALARSPRLSATVIKGFTFLNLSRDYRPRPLSRVTLIE